LSAAIGNFLLSTRKGKIVLVALLVFVVIVVVLGLTVCNPMTVVSQGTVLSISSQQYLQYGFARPPNSEGATYGAFTSNNGVTLYVMSAAQYSNFTSRIATQVIYSTGQVNSASLSGGKSGGASLAYLHAPGQYYFVFYDDGYSTTSVTITMALSVETC